MNNDIKTKAVRSKDIMLKLINQGFVLLDVSINEKNNKPCYIFDNTVKFQAAFNELMQHHINCGLTEFERKFLIEMLCVKKYELQRSNLKADTVDGIINKLSGSNVEAKKDNGDNGELKIIRKMPEGYKNLIDDGLSSKLMEHIKNNPVNLANNLLTNNLLNINPNFDLIRR